MIKLYRFGKYFDCVRVLQHSFCSQECAELSRNTETVHAFSRCRLSLLKLHIGRAETKTAIFSFEACATHLSLAWSLFEMSHAAQRFGQRGLRQADQDQRYIAKQGACNMTPPFLQKTKKCQFRAYPYHANTVDNHVFLRDTASIARAALTAGVRPGCEFTISSCFSSRHSARLQRLHRGVGRRALRRAQLHRPRRDASYEETGLYAPPPQIFRGKVSQERQEEADAKPGANRGPPNADGNEAE